LKRENEKKQFGIEGTIKDFAICAVWKNIVTKRKT